MRASVRKQRTASLVVVIAGIATLQTSLVKQRKRVSRVLSGNMKRHFAKAGLALLLLLPGCAWSGDRPQEHIVRVISDLDSGRMYFEPREIRIAPGDTVVWVNQNEIPHNMVTYPDGFPRGASGFKSPDLSAAGEFWSHRFDVAGSYEYHCVPHVIMDMQGSVIVGRPSEAAEFHQPSAAEIASYRELLLEYFDEDEGMDYRPRSERLAFRPVGSSRHAEHQSH